MYYCANMSNKHTKPQAERDPDDEVGEGVFESLVAEASKSDKTKEKEKLKKEEAAAAKLAAHNSEKRAKKSEASTSRTETHSRSASASHREHHAAGGYVPGAQETQAL